MVQLEIAEKMMSVLGPKPITYNKLWRATKLNPRTVRRYLEFICEVQKWDKIEVEKKGFRLLIRKGK